MGHLDDLRAVPLIDTLWSQSGPWVPTWRRWALQAELQLELPEPAVTVNDEGHAIQAALAGQGVILASLPLVAEELGRGVLVQPFQTVLPGLTCRLVHAGQPKQSVAKVRHWIIAEFGGAPDTR